LPSPKWRGGHLDGIVTHSILSIPVRSGTEDEFVAAFADLDVLGHAARIPAFRGGTLLRPQAAGDAFVVHARWDGPDGYQAWLDAPIRAELNQGLAPFVAGTMSGRVYDEIEL
jgi:heme-degrading monooxygenase HmoA